MTRLITAAVVLALASSNYAADESKKTADSKSGSLFGDFDLFKAMELAKNLMQYVS